MAHILVPFDFSKNAQAALDQALLIASKSGKTVEVLHVTNKAVCQEYPESWECDETDVATLQEKVESRIAEQATALQLAPGSVASAHVAEAALVSGGITAHMLHSQAQLLVMGTHGTTGLVDKVFGSNTAAMVNHALFPVLTVPPAWKPAVIEHCIAALKLSKLQYSSETLLKWSEFFNCSIEAVQFSIVPESEGAIANEKNIGGVPCRMVKNDIETPLAEDLLQYTQHLKNTMLLLFTREKSFLEKLFRPTLAHKVSGAITIPLLSLPLENRADKNQS